MQELIIILYTLFFFSNILLVCARSKRAKPRTIRAESVTLNSEKPKDTVQSQKTETTKSSMKDTAKETARKSDPSKGKAVKVIKTSTPKQDAPRAPYGYNAELIAMQEQMLSDIMKSDRKGSDREFSRLAPPEPPTRFDIARTQSDDGR